MPEEFNPDLTLETSQVFDVARAPEQTLQQVDKQRGHRLGASVGGACLALTASLGFGPGLAPAEASANTQNYDPNATFAEKVQNVEVIAHRGLKGYYKGRIADEDTVRSCEHAIAEGADVCEIDIWTPKHAASVTPKPIVMHDRTTNRVTRDCNLDIPTHTYRRLKHCHMNHGDLISSLSELAVAMSPYRDRVGIIAEIKDPNATKKELRTINNIFAKNGFNASNLKYESFYGTKLRLMKSVAPSVAGLLIQGKLSSPMRAANLPSVFDGLIIPYQAYVNGVQSDPQYADEFRARGEDIIAWGVETVDQMTYFTQHDGSGFMTDYTPRAKQLG